MRTLIVDDQTLFGQSLKFLLEDLHPGMACETASTLAGAVAKPGPFDLILLDYSFPRESHSANGLERMRKAHTDATIVMVSGEDSPQLVHQLIARGAAGFVPKAVDVETLLHALRTILAGGIYVPTFALRYVPTHARTSEHNAMAFVGEHADFQQSSPALADGPDSETGAPLRQLSKRQIDCLLMVAQGKSNRLIASELFLAESTVKTHVTAAFKILDVTTRAEAVFKAASLGLLPSSARQNSDY